MKWSVEFLNAEVDGEFLSLPKDMQARFVRISELIQEYGLDHVGMPHVRHVEGLYVGVTGRRVVILRIFVKKTQKTPRSEILLALERMKEL